MRAFNYIERRNLCFRYYRRIKAGETIVVEGTLYPLLTRLKNNGLLAYNWVESTSGPPRKYYVLTEDGKKMLAQLDTTWQELAYAITTSQKGAVK